MLFNTLRPRQNGRHFADDIFKYIFLNENVWIPIKISLKFVPKGWINNIPALVPMMAWRRPGDKPLSEPMLISLLTHICVTRPQWVKKHIGKKRHLLWHFYVWHTGKFTFFLTISNNNINKYVYENKSMIHYNMLINPIDPFRILFIRVVVVSIDTYKSRLIHESEHTYVK